MESGAKSVLGELEVLVHLQKLLHLLYGDAAFASGVHLLEHAGQTQLLEEHLAHEHR